MTTVDALLLWARAQLGRLAELHRQMTRPERVLSAVLVAWIVGTIAVWPVLDAWPTWMVAVDAVGVAVLFCPVLADALMARAILRRTNDALLHTNATIPTGAPRVAEVPCRHGDMHRFVYGPDGWAAAGPAPDTRPEEARTP